MGIPSNCQSPGREEKCRVANLIVTEERMGRARIPADIRSGTVEAGDLVFLYRNLAVPERTGKMDEQKPCLLYTSRCV